MQYLMDCGMPWVGTSHQVDADFLTRDALTMGIELTKTNGLVVLLPNPHGSIGQTNVLPLLLSMIKSCCAGGSAEALMESAKAL